MHAVGPHLRQHLAHPLGLRARLADQARLAELDQHALGARARSALARSGSADGPAAPAGRGRRPARSDRCADAAGSVSRPGLDTLACGQSIGVAHGPLVLRGAIATTHHVDIMPVRGEKADVELKDLTPDERLALVVLLEMVMDSATTLTESRRRSGADDHRRGRRGGVSRGGRRGGPAFRTTRTR